MWPFNGKRITHPAATQPLDIQLKSLTLPAANPHWNLFGQSDKWKTQVAIDEGYNASAIAYACIEKRAKLLASIPWIVETKTKDGWERNDKHPLSQLIESPNPSQSWYEIIYGASQQLDLSGNAYISEIKAGARNLPRELWLLPSKNMRIKAGRQNLIDLYEYGHGAGWSKIEPEDMIQLMFPNPDSPYFGQPTLRAAGRPVDIDRESGIWQKASLENRSVVDLYLKLPDNTTPEQAEHAREQLKQRQQAPANARKPLATTAEVKNLGQTAVELDFVASRRAVWTEICAAFGMSLADLGMTESVNLANAESMNKALIENTIIPLLTLIEHQLNHQLAREFGNDVRMRGDLSNVAALQEAEADKLAKAEKLHRLGVPFNVINQKLELGFDEIEGGDVGYIASGLIPVTFNMSDEADPSTAGRDAYGDS